MSKLMKEFWAKMNYPPGLLETLMTPVADDADPEDIPDVAELATGFKETQRKLFESTSGLFTKEHLDAEFNKHRGSLAVALNKKLGLGYSRSEVTGMEWSDFIDKAAEYVENQIETAAKGTDETLRSQLRDLTNEKIKILQEKQAIEDDIENRVQAKTQALEAELNRESVDRLFNEEFGKLKWPEKNKHIYQTYIRQKVEDNYEIHRDGKLTQDGGKDAINFTKNGHYGHIADPIKFLYESEGMDPKHKGGTGGAPIFSGAVSIEGDLTENSKAMAERIKQHRMSDGR